MRAGTSNCAPVPSHGWPYIRKNIVLNRTSNGGSYPPPPKCSQIPRMGWRCVDVTGSDKQRDRKSIKTHCIRVKKIIFCLMESRERPDYRRDMCNVLVTSRRPFYLQIQQEFHFLPNSLIAVRITRFRVRVDNTFVKDETILFDAWNHFDTFLF